LLERPRATLAAPRRELASPGIAGVALHRHGFLSALPRAASGRRGLPAVVRPPRQWPFQKPDVAKRITCHDERVARDDGREWRVAVMCEHASKCREVPYLQRSILRRRDQPSTVRRHCARGHFVAVVVQGSQHTFTAHIPHLQRAVLRDRDCVSTIGRYRASGHAASVTFHRDGHAVARRIPDVKVTIRRDDESPVRRCGARRDPNNRRR